MSNEIWHEFKADSKATLYCNCGYHRDALIHRTKPTKPPTEQQEEIVRLQPRLVPDGDGFVIRMLPAANGEYVAYSDLAALREHRVFTDLAAAREQIARLESKKAQAFNDGVEAAALFVDSLRGEGVSDLREVRDGIRSEVKRPTPPQADMEDKG